MGRNLHPKHHTDQNMASKSIQITQRGFENIKQRTGAYKGLKYSFNAHCPNCAETIFTNSQTIEGARTKQEMRDCRDWVVLCKKCFEIIDSGKKIEII